MIFRDLQPATRARSQSSARTSRGAIIAPFARTLADAYPNVSVVKQASGSRSSSWRKDRESMAIAAGATSSAKLPSPALDNVLFCSPGRVAARRVVSHCTNRLCKVSTRVAARTDVNSQRAAWHDEYETDCFTIPVTNAPAPPLSIYTCLKSYVLPLRCYVPREWKSGCALRTDRLGGFLISGFASRQKLAPPPWRFSSSSYPANFSELDPCAIFFFHTTGRVLFSLFLSLASIHHSLLLFLSSAIFSFLPIPQKYGKGTEK